MTASMTVWHARLTEAEIDALIAAKLTASEWSVYVTLRLYADQKGIAFPSVRTLSTRTKIERRNVQIAIDRLVEKHLIKTETRLTKNGAHNTNIYTFLLLQAAVEATPPLAAETTPGGVADDARVASQDTPKQTHLTDQKTDARFARESHARASPQQPSEQVELLMPIEGGRSAAQNGGAQCDERSQSGSGKTQLPADWCPNAEDCYFARDRGHDDAWISEQWAAFRDWHASKADRSADWHAEFRSWCRRADLFGTSRRAPAEKSRGIVAAVRAVQARYAMEECGDGVDWLGRLRQ